MAVTENGACSGEICQQKRQGNMTLLFDLSFFYWWKGT